MSWVDRKMQKTILESLMEFYGQPVSQFELTKFIWSDKNFDFSVYRPAKEAEILGIEQSERDEFADKVIKNLIYLDQHGLIDMSNEGFDMWMCHMQITHKGIDFLEQDGGLSAIFDTITIKLHNESIQALLKEKINQSDIPEEEKGYLISELMKIKDAALNTLTENAINNISAVTVVSWLKAAIGL